MDCLFRVAVVCLSLGAGTAIAAESWPEFRGPTGQGNAGDAQVPLHWSGTENVTWRQTIPGIAWSSPVVVNGRIYLTTAVDVTPPPAEMPENAEESQSPAEPVDPAVELGAMCLAAESGEILWQKTLFVQRGEVEIHKKNSHASPTPVVEGEALYLHFGPHGTARLTLDGEVVWTQKLDYSPTHGNGGSPAIAEDLLIICCDGHDVQYAVALEKETGKVRWKKDRGVKASKGFSFGTPLVVEVNGQLQAVCPASGAVYAYEPQTGNEIWRVEYGDGYSVTPRPIYAAGLIFVCTGYNKPLLLAIDPTGAGNVTETHVRWQTDKHVPHSPSLVHSGNLLFFVSDKGIARCVDAATGESRWQERLGGNYSASPLAAQGRIYFQNEEGEAIVVAASAEFEELARNRLTEEERTFASYAVCDGALFIRSEGHLFRIEQK
ncbi:PQQ-binding-like beta-propeller repeat protein [Planctomicrobium sp. SH661]|uniref:PQQ-binding-like beta-propeller repeat protein n=1 Tax=Planctomicrobium sp. SH661 TaxID=3448124 RepID=UPI003F5BFDED